MGVSSGSTRRKLALARLHVDLAKAYDPSKHPHKGHGPGGGQFAPKGEGGGDAKPHWWQHWFGGAHQDDPYASHLPGFVANHLGHPHEVDPNKPPPEPYHAKAHTKWAQQHRATDDKGGTVYIQTPTKPGDPAAWRDPNAVATAVMGGRVPPVLNGVPFRAWEPGDNYDWTKVPGQNPGVEADLPDLDVKHGHPAAGVIIEEPDGRVWLTRPTNGYGGYDHTFPKGTQEHGLTLQQTAIKEAWEETGLKVEITGVLGDFVRTTSTARYFYAKRVGGDPSRQGWESQALRLAPLAKLKSLVNKKADHRIADILLHDTELSKGLTDEVRASALANLAAAVNGTGGTFTVGPRTLALLRKFKKGSDADGDGEAEGHKGNGRKGAPQTAHGALKDRTGLHAPTQVMFEVAPDPNNAALTSVWNGLSDEDKQDISKQVATDIVPQVLHAIGAEGAVGEQVGGYMGATNPSLALEIDPEHAVAAAKMLGHALSQDSMMVVSPKATKGLDAIGVVAVNLPPNQQNIGAITKIYDTLYTLHDGAGNAVVGGFTASHGRMEILNFSGMSDIKLAGLVNDALEDQFEVHSTTAYAAFIEKKDYADAGHAVEGDAAVRGAGTGDLRSAATQALYRHLRERSGKARGRPLLKGREAGRSLLKAFDESKHQRWPKGTPLAGQFMEVDGAGLPLPPKVGSATNQEHQLQVNAMYAAAKAGDWGTLAKLAVKPTLKFMDLGGSSSGGEYHPAGYKGAALSFPSKHPETGKPLNTQQKWALQKVQYAQALIDGPGMAAQVEANVDRVAGPASLTTYKKIGPPPSMGSNPALIYEKGGQKFYVKGSAATKGEPGAGPGWQQARPKNEVLAGKLMAAAGAGVVEQHLVKDAPKELGGGYAVAGKWVDGGPVNNLPGIVAVQQDFAVHAWLSNYDVVGPDFANSKLVDGKAVNIDPGGALLFRAQGQLKFPIMPFGQMPKDVPEWDTLRNPGINAAAASIYGSMTASDLKASAQKLQLVNDKTINDLVNAYGPGDVAAKHNLIGSLIARRDAILAKVGLASPNTGKPSAAVATPDVAPSAAKQQAEKAAKDIISGDDVAHLKPASATFTGVKHNNLDQTVEAFTAVAAANTAIGALGEHGKYKAKLTALANTITTAKTANEQSAAFDALKEIGAKAHEGSYLDNAIKATKALASHISVHMAMGEPPANSASVAIPADIAAIKAKLDPLAVKVLSGNGSAIPVMGAMKLIEQTAVKGDVAKLQEFASNWHDTSSVVPPFTGEKRAATKLIGDYALAHAAALEAKDIAPPGPEVFTLAVSNVKPLRAQEAAALKGLHDKAAAGDQQALSELKSATASYHGSVGAVGSPAGTKQAKLILAEYGDKLIAHLEAKAPPSNAAFEAEHQRGPGGKFAKMPTKADFAQIWPGNGGSWATLVKDANAGGVGSSAWMSLKSGIKSITGLGTNTDKALALVQPWVDAMEAKHSAAPTAADLEALALTANEKFGPLHNSGPWKVETEAAKAGVDYALEHNDATGLKNIIDHFTGEGIAPASGKWGSVAEGSIAGEAKAALLAYATAAEAHIKANGGVHAMKAGEGVVGASAGLHGVPFPTVAELDEGKPPMAAAGEAWADYVENDLAPVYGTDKWEGEKAKQRISMVNANMAGSEAVKHYAGKVYNWMKAVEAADPAKASPTTIDPKWLKDYGTGGPASIYAQWITEGQYDKAIIGAKTWATYEGDSTNSQAKAEEFGVHVIAVATAAKVAAQAQASTAPTKPSAQPIPAFDGKAKGHYDKLAEQALAAYDAGDLKKLTNIHLKAGGSGSNVGALDEHGNPTTSNGVKFTLWQAKLVDGLSHDNNDLKVVKIEEALNAQVEGVKAGEKKADLPAMPDFNKYLLPADNSNATKQNGKTLSIQTYAEQGNPRALLAMGFGTNTYAKKQVKLVNDALAALGVPEKVVAGQKKNSHPALAAFMSPDAAAALMANAGKGVDPHAFAPAKKKIIPVLSDAELPATTTFTMSSKAHVNAANEAVQAHLVAMAKAGDLEGMKAATFPEIDKETGKPTGKVLPVSQHPSKWITNFQTAAIEAMDEKANPPDPLKVFEAQKAAASIAAVAKQFPPKPFGTTPNHVKSNEKVGFWIALGQVQGFEKLVPPKTMNLSPTAIAQAKSDYGKMSSSAQSFVGGVQGGGLNSQYQAGKLTSGGNDLLALAKAAHEYAREQPPGTTIYRWQVTPSDMMKKLETAPPGLIIQNPAPSCASYDPTATKGFGGSSNPHRLKIIYAAGAKAINSFGSGNYSGEMEVTTLPNARFILVKHEKPHTNGHAWAETTLLMLPPDPALDGDKLGQKHH